LYQKSERLISNTVTIKGVLQQSHKGGSGTGEFHSQYTTLVFADYDEAGNKTVQYTFLETEQVYNKVPLMKHTR